MESEDVAEFTIELDANQRWLMLQLSEFGPDGDSYFDELVYEVALQVRKQMKISVRLRTNEEE